ncbi:MAG: tRNA 2-thiocytidine(32) synthetase TtcA [Bdellovibrionaceae bacterium]|nr:tRNA 2-thiocytidine(32) synthetase TtcA [Pseudobdellovibrionaceae bacterium]
METSPDKASKPPTSDRKEVDQALTTVRKKCVKALNDFGMIQDGDRIMVAVSGGKDSSVLLYTLLQIQKKSKFNFSLYPVILDQKQPGFYVDAFKKWVDSLGLELKVLQQDTYSIVKEKVPEGKTFCSLCSRLRRGILYNHAHEMGFNKIALGHHADDAIETLFLNQFYSGKISSMPPVLRSDDGRNLLLRPFCYVYENEIIDGQRILSPPVIPCNLCGSQDNLKRKKIKQLIAQLESESPQLKASLLNSLGNVRASQLFDQTLFSFKNL